jgi:hypothetical protein
MSILSGEQRRQLSPTHPERTFKLLPQVRGNRSWFRDRKPPLTVHQNQALAR